MSATRTRSVASSAPAPAGLVRSNTVLLCRVPGFVESRQSRSVGIFLSGLHESENPKTGNMIQVYILSLSEHPTEAIRQYRESVSDSPSPSPSIHPVCGTCPHIGTSCYVREYAGPGGIFRAWKSGSIPELSGSSSPGSPAWRKAFRQSVAPMLAGRKIRFGAYGDPILIPLSVVRSLIKATGLDRRAHTGYTHAWAQPKFKRSSYRSFFMASVDSIHEQLSAKLAGWRTARVARSPHLVDPYLLPSESICPAVKSKGKVQCIDCMLCDGNGESRNAHSRDIVFPAHGARAGLIALDTV